ncbi:related to dienelactone hydrolase family protein [Rhynchosporium secalis]|uniref:Related to dienelactone hydrolase family protein n=1 Tax=Rhynchosporium secalis TaxID=38038 RepID=A0A1E1LYX6_RHYSE|nr:related to dienelactone hydrolase family protein [Rhynchosporium secalis]
MRVQLQLLAFVATLTFASPETYGYDPVLKHEHPGQLFNHVSSKSKCIGGVLTNKNSTGKYETVGGTNTYLAYPPGKPKNEKKTDIAILYLTDIFGTQLVNNRLLADSLALAGYFVVQPDLFNGDPIRVDQLGDPSFNITEWSQRHPQAAIDAIVTSSITAMKKDYGVKKIGGVGYCFGGKYVARFLAPGKGLDAGFTAHPSNVVADEWKGVAGPLSIAFGELDASSTPAQRAAAEAIFQSTNITFQTNLYSNAEHGFAVRTNLTDPQKAFAQESAYFQAVRWFDAWIK